MPFTGVELAAEQGFHARKRIAGRMPAAPLS